jgi:superfamily II DNA or RNA helicase
MAKPERDAAIQGLADGTTEVLTSCEIISEGLDVPSVGAVILLRPTKSLTMCLQQIGRGMRPGPGKVLTVLDHAGNCITHGLPTDERTWTLDGIDKEKEATAPKPWECLGCHELNGANLLECRGCGELRRGPARAATARAATARTGRRTGPR